MSSVRVPAPSLKGPSPSLWLRMLAPEQHFSTQFVCKVVYSPVCYRWTRRCRRATEKRSSRRHIEDDTEEANSGSLRDSCADRSRDCGLTARKGSFNGRSAIRRSPSRRAHGLQKVKEETADTRRTQTNRGSGKKTLGRAEEEGGRRQVGCATNQRARSTGPFSFRRLRFARPSVA